ncbi:MAG: Eco57I restriction-modification methylase domain-containing protein [Cyclobacteriaceae bacterium]
MERLINEIKTNFRSEISQNDPKIKRLRKLNGELFTLTNQGQLFELSKKEKTEWNKKVKKLTEQTQKLEKEIEGIKNNKIYENAFEWRFEFPEILNDDGDFLGFDVVIGNPPYIRVQELEHNHIDYYKSNFDISYKRVDISILFFELAYRVLKRDGISTYITSNQFITTEYGKLCRSFLMDNLGMNNMIDFHDLPVFEDALTYVSVFIFSKSLVDSFKYNSVSSIELAKNWDFGVATLIEKENQLNDYWVLKPKSEINLLEKLSSHNSLKEYGSCNYGIVSGNDDIFIISDEIICKYGIESELQLPLIRANDCGRYKTVESSLKILYPYKEIDGKTILIDIKELQSNYPNTYNYLEINKKKLENRKDSRKTFEGKNNWYSLTRFGTLNTFSSEKIIFPGETKQNKFGVSKSLAGYSGARVFAIKLNEDYSDKIHILLGILNSKLAEYILHNRASLKQGGYYSYSSTVLNDFPLPNLDSKEVDFCVREILKLTENEKQLDTSEFENRIDAEVYNLYGLSKDEIKIIEESE